MTAEYTRNSRVTQRGGQMEQASALLKTEQRKLQADEMQTSQEQRHVRLQNQSRHERGVKDGRWLTFN